LFFAAVAVVVLIVVIVVAAASGSSPKTTNHVSAGQAQPAASQPAYSQSAAPATPAPTTPAPTTAAPTKPALTVSQQQAVQSAQSYLSNVGGFSQYSLLQQLTSSAGAGFSQADAQFAINYLHPDWYQQAVQSAKSYMSTVGGFSAASLYDQLTSTAGAGFTPGQANYALKQVGL